jgi:hypothetical protein
VVNSIQDIGLANAVGPNNAIHFRVKGEITLVEILVVE